MNHLHLGAMLKCTVSLFSWNYSGQIFYNSINDLSVHFVMCLYMCVSLFLFLHMQRNIYCQNFSWSLYLYGMKNYHQRDMKSLNNCILHPWTCKILLGMQQLLSQWENRYGLSHCWPSLWSSILINYVSNMFFLNFIFKSEYMPWNQRWSHVLKALSQLAHDQKRPNSCAIEKFRFGS